MTTAYTAFSRNNKRHCSIEDFKNGEGCLLNGVDFFISDREEMMKGDIFLINFRDRVTMKIIFQWDLNRNTFKAY